MKYFLIALLIGVVILIQIIFATLMRKAAARKGYGDDTHTWAMCFWLGIIGGIYVIALPDLIQQNQNQQIIELLKSRSDSND